MRRAPVSAVIAAVLVVAAIPASVANAAAATVTPAAEPAIYVGPPFSIVGVGPRSKNIYWYNSQTGETQIWSMSGNRLIHRATVIGPDGNPTAIGTPFSIVGVGDFSGHNGIGGDDIVWYNSQTGETQIWFMNDNQLVGRATVVGPDGNPSFIGPPFSIVGIGDFDGDGKADIVWHHSQTNETQIWFMNGNQLVQRATVVGPDGNPSVVGDPFSIVGIGRSGS